MIKILKVKEKKSLDSKIFKMLRPYFSEWFRNKFGKFTLPQKYSIPLIKEGKNVLITSPTGSGKTLACFAAVLDYLFELAEKNQLENKVYCIYVSPLRALDNDIRRNLEVPLKEVSEIAKRKGINLQEIRIAIRTGDTKPSEKQKQLKYAPHILITTPETLGIILSTKKFKEKLKDVKFVIIDEIHELANNKRGVHLSLSLERLEYFVGKPVQRIGAGATLEPLEEAAKFLVGNNRSCIVIDARFVKPVDIKVLIPSKNLILEKAEEINKKMYKLIDKLVSKHTTTLIFTNTRSGAERVHLHLKQLFPTKYLDETTGVHHSSVSRDIRFEVEEKLKQGKLKCVISSTSLELGIDIGYIDLVIQIGSPKSVSRLLQRIGRAGHSLHEISKGRIICLDRDDLVECSVMVKKSKEYWLDKFYMPKNCLDVLAQHLVGMALEKKWNINEAYELVKKAYPYKDLDFETFLRVLKYLAGYYHTLEDFNIYGKIWLDLNEQKFGRKKNSRVIYMLNSGVIPEEVKIVVKTLEGKFAGFIEEGFLERLSYGDIFVLGGKTYEFIKSVKNIAYVREVKEKRPTIPSWFSEQLPLNFDLAIEIGKFRGKTFELLENKKSKKEILKFLKEYLDFDINVAKEIYEYFYLEYKFLKLLGAKKFPSEKVILIENVIDKRNQNIVFHTLYGRRVNDALSRAYAYALSNYLGKSIGIAINDNGFVLIIPREKHANKWYNIFEIKKKTEFVNPEEVLKLVNSENFEELLRKSLINTELIKRKFRHVASRAFMILRNYKGHEISLEKQQMNAERLIKIVKDIPDFPILEETYREILEDFMDVKNAKEILKKIEKGEIVVEILKESDLPSPFAHNLFVLSESDVVLMEDRRKLLLKLYEKIKERIESKALARA
ncbi:MAG: ATP-dependent helicase [Candidatus Aenigmatarchaeota archaeon]